MSDVMETLERRFTSGNDVAVDRAYITKAEFEQLQSRINDQWVSEEVKARFWSSANKSNYCWEWQGSKNRHGYGTFRIGKDPVLAHRVSYRLIYGDVGDLNICHKCDNPACINPDHLFSGTHQDNMSDMQDKGRGRVSATGKTSKYNGVSLRSDSGAWRAGFIREKKRYSAGCFNNEIDAAKAVDKLYVEMFGDDYPLINFPLPKDND